MTTRRRRPGAAIHEELEAGHPKQGKQHGSESGSHLWVWSTRGCTAAARFLAARSPLAQTPAPRVRQEPPPPPRPCLPCHWLPAALLLVVLLLGVLPAARLPAAEGRPSSAGTAAGKRAKSWGREACTTRPAPDLRVNPMLPAAPAPGPGRWGHQASTRTDRQTAGVWLRLACSPNISPSRQPTHAAHPSSLPAHPPGWARAACCA